ncbi:MAG: dTMP kinase [Planctomycetaceae bacterium]|jgi:dTMP kinase|nr:dTMP kinase [Planctomycetaceae bacterium]
MFITIDGCDGCGKTTQQIRLGKWLQSKGRDTVLCRDPGGTTLGNKIREIVLGGNIKNFDNKNITKNKIYNNGNNDGKFQDEMLNDNISDKSNKLNVSDKGSDNYGENIHICNVAEMLLFMASRSQLVNEIIYPAIMSGKDVISDRFLISNIVYQGYAGGVSIEAIEFIGEIATSGIKPDLGIILDIPYEVSVKRMNNRLKDRIESKGEKYHKSVCDGFLDYAKKNPHYAVIDASPAADVVELAIRQAVETKINYENL